MWPQVHSIAGAQVRKHLPGGLNPKILEQLESEFAAQAGSPAAATAGPPGRVGGGAGTPLGGSRAAPAPRPASPPVPAVTRRLSEGVPFPAPAAAAGRTGKSGSGKAAAAAAVAPVTVLASAHASSHYSLAEAYPIDPPHYNAGAPFDNHSILSGLLTKNVLSCKWVRCSLPWTNNHLPGTVCVKVVFHTLHCCMPSHHREAIEYCLSAEPIKASWTRDLHTIQTVSGRRTQT